MSNCAQFKYRSTAGLKCAELHIGLCCYPDVTLVSSFGFSSFITGVWKVLRWLLLLGFVLMAFNTLYLYAPNVASRGLEDYRTARMFGELAVAGGNSRCGGRGV